MEKEIPQLSNDDINMWNYYNWRDKGSLHISSYAQEQTDLDTTSCSSIESFTTTTADSEISEFTPDDNQVLRRHAEMERLHPTTTKTAQRIIADQEFLHLLKMEEDKDYRTSYNTLTQRNKE